LGLIKFPRKKFGLKIPNPRKNLNKEGNKKKAFPKEVQNNGRRPKGLPGFRLKP